MRGWRLWAWRTINALLVIVGGAGFIVLAAGLAYIWVEDIQLWRATWMTTTGEIQQVDFAAPQEYSIDYSSEVQYTYTVDGKPYIAHRLDLAFGSGYKAEEVHAIRA